MQLAPAAERQPFVRDGVDERVAEPEPAVGVALDEPAQALPQDVVRLHLVAERRVEQVLVERDAENRRVPEHDPVGGREPVDVGGHDRLDRVGQLVGRPGRAGDVEQLDEEERASARAARELLDLVRPERLLVGRDLDDLGGVALGERQQVEGEEAQLVVLDVRPHARRLRARHDECVRQRLPRLRDAAQEIGARVVHELRVLDHEGERLGREPGREEPARDVGEGLAEEALVDRLRLGSRRQVEAERDAEQRHPRDELRIGFCDGGTQGALRVGRRVVGRDADELAQETAHGVVRVDASYSSHVARNTRSPPAAASASRMRRVLPMPDGPAISTIHAAPGRRRRRARSAGRRARGRDRRTASRRSAPRGGRRSRRRATP